MRVVDSHLHLWRLSTPGHEWPTAETPALHRDFTAADLRAIAASADLAGVVLVQSQPTDADTDWLLGLAACEPLVLGVVGWVDLAATAAPTRIATLARHPKLRGLRPMLQAVADTDWLLGQALAPAVAAMVEHGLRLDALAEVRHLPMLARFADRWQDLPLVIDHAAKPDMTAPPPAAWRDGMAALADRGAWCKLSGMRTQQAPGQPVDELARYVDPLIEWFGKRLMWGSDWPVLTRFGERYDRWLADAQRLAGLHGPARERLFAGGAREFYALP